jgi:hypothetical protein
MAKSWGAISWLVGGALLCGCGGGPAPAGSAVRDSAGLRIVESVTPTWPAGRGWRVEPQALLDIGLAGGAPEYELYRVGDALILGDGGVLIANGGSSQLRSYDGGGRHLRNLGRRGEGPGEFAEFSGMRFCAFDGDSLIVDDGGNDRQQIWAGDVFVRGFRLAVPQHGGRAFHAGCFGDGTLLTISALGGGALSGEPGTVIRTTWAAHRHAADGTLLAEIERYPDRPRFVNQVGETVHYPFVPLHAAPVLAAASGHAWFGDGGSPELRRVTADGRPDAIVRWHPAQRIRTRDVWARYQSAALETMPPQTQLRYRRLFEQNLPLPDFVPVYQSLIISSEGELWVERFRLPWEEDPVWEIFDADGVWLGAVDTPRGLRVLRVERDRLVGRHTDELGVERVRVHALTR